MLKSGNGLFNSDGKLFWSASLLRRMEKYEALKEKRSQAANARWNKEKQKDEKKNNNAKQCKCIKKICKCITLEKGKQYTCSTKLCKLNKNKSNQKKSKKIKLNEMKSIYPSGYTNRKMENKTLDNMMNETEWMEYDRIIENCHIYSFDIGLAIEIKEIIKEMYMTQETREKIQELNHKSLLYALKNFAVANAKTKISIPKAYFKKCILSALDQTELSEQYDFDTVYEMEDY